MGQWKQDRARRSVGAAAEATFFLLLGIGVVWFARKVADVGNGAVLTSLVVVPALLYVVLRGSVAELRAPGGWAATFVRVARTRVQAAGETLDVVQDVQIIAKESLAGLTSRAGTLQPDQPVLMTMTLGQYYSEADVVRYLDTLSPFPRFRLVALLDDSGTFVGCLGPAQLRGLMKPGLGQGFLDALARGDAGEVFRYPGTLRKVVPASATNAEALLAMTWNNLDAIAIVGEDRKLRGVAEREQLVSRLVLSLTDATTS